MAQILDGGISGVFSDFSTEISDRRWFCVFSTFKQLFLLLCCSQIRSTSLSTLHISSFLSFLPAKCSSWLKERVFWEIFIYISEPLFKPKCRSFEVNLKTLIWKPQWVNPIVFIHTLYVLRTLLLGGGHSWTCVYWGRCLSRPLHKLLCRKTRNKALSQLTLC